MNIHKKINQTEFVKLYHANVITYYIT